MMKQKKSCVKVISKENKQLVKTLIMKSKKKKYVKVIIKESKQFVKILLIKQKRNCINVRKES